MILEFPGYTLRDYALELEKEFQVSLTTARICQILKEHEFNRKVVASVCKVRGLMSRCKKKLKSETLFFGLTGFES